MDAAQQRRYISEKLNDFKYKRINPVFDACIYCGETARVWDHVPPISIADGYNGMFFKVPSCRSCNAYLFHKPFFALSVRKEHIRQRLFRKTDLYIPIWEVDELDSIKGWVNKYIKYGLNNQRILKRRILYITATMGEEFTDYLA